MNAFFTTESFNRIANECCIIGTMLFLCQFGQLPSVGDEVKQILEKSEVWIASRDGPISKNHTRLYCINFEIGNNNYTL